MYEIGLDFNFKLTSSSYSDFGNSVSNRLTWIAFDEIE